MSELLTWTDGTFVLKPAPDMDFRVGQRLIIDDVRYRIVDVHHGNYHLVPDPKSDG